MSEIKQLVRAEPGFRAAYTIDEDRRQVGFIPIVFWAVYPDRVIALVMPEEGEELVPASTDPDWGKFIRLAGPETDDSEVIEQAERQADEESECDDREADKEVTVMLAAIGIQLELGEARTLRHFFGNVDDRHHGIISPGRKRAIEHLIAANRGRRDQE